MVGDDKKKFEKSLTEYRKRFEPLYGKLKEWQPIVSKDKDIVKTIDLNIFRSEFLSIQSFKFTVEECKQLWKSIEGEKSKASDSELEGKYLSNALRLDFTMTYYQMNTFLVDHFFDSDYFCRMSRLDLINEYKPATLQVVNLRDLESKARGLEMIK